jgi:hypothetical protein
MRWTEWTSYSGGKRLIRDGTCRTCKREVQLDTLPPANGIDAGGDALAINCDL